MASLRKAFKSYTHKHTPSANEQQHILIPEAETTTSDYIVSIDDNETVNNSTTEPAATIPREASYDFAAVSFRDSWNAGTVADDPPSQLIREFLDKQNQENSIPEIFLDIDRAVEVELQKTPSFASNASKECRVSFDPQGPRPLKKRSPSSSDDDDSSSTSSSSSSSSGVVRKDGGGTPSSYRGNSMMLRSKTKSRLIDPPLHCNAPFRDAKSGRAPQTGQGKSSMLGSVNEDDDFDDGDMPSEFHRRSNLSILMIIQWVSLVLLLTALILTLSIVPARWQKLLSLHLWKWEVLVLVLICGRLVSGWVIRIAIFFIERNFLFRKRVLYFVYGVRRGVQNCLWLGLVLLSWHFLFDSHEERGLALPYVTKGLICLLVATILHLVKTVLVKVLASSFHVSTYFDRIQDSLFNQYVVETLTGPPLIEIEQCIEEEEQMLAEVESFQNAGASIPNDLMRAAVPPKNGKVIGGSMGGSAGKNGSQGKPKSSTIGKSVKLSGAGSMTNKESAKLVGEGITIDQLHRLNQKNVSAWNMKRLMTIVRHGALSTLDDKLPPTSGEDESVVTIRSECEAKIAARKIFSNVAKPGSRYIYLVDLMRFMREEEAIKTINLFEGVIENKRISRKSLKNWVVNAFRERRALALTLNDTKTAVNKLHQMANVVIGIIIFAISLLILGIATTQFFVFLSSQLLLAVFIFGNTLKMIFEAIIFLFVMHPFDVGDRCEVEGNQLVVEEMNILTTVFLTDNNTKVTYPNTMLATRPISNFYRSPDQGDAIDFCVNVSTPVEKLAHMKERIIGFMESKKDYYYPGMMVVLRDIEDLNKLQISIWFRHTLNFQDMGMKFTRRELILQELMKILREQDIEYRMLPLDVNCREMPILTSTRLPSTWSNN